MSKLGDVADIEENGLNDKLRPTMEELIAKYEDPTPPDMQELDAQTAMERARSRSETGGATSKEGTPNTSTRKLQVYACVGITVLALIVIVGFMAGHGKK